MTPTPASQMPLLHPSASVDDLAAALAAADLSRETNPDDATARYTAILDAALPAPDLDADLSLPAAAAAPSAITGTGADSNFKSNLNSNSNSNTNSSASRPPAGADDNAASSSATATAEDSVARALRLKEAALMQLARLLRDRAQAAELTALCTRARPFLSALPKAKTAKLLRTLIDMLAEIPGSLPLQVGACRDAIAWAAGEQRAYLRRALEIKLAAMYLDKRMFSDALALIALLLTELRRLDDKPVLVDVQLLESRVHLAVRNVAKAKAALTAARTAANSIYCPPAQQAALDLQAGVLNAEDRDFKTAYSYFYETFDGYVSAGDTARALCALRYMLLAKILLGSPADVNALLQLKVTAPFASAGDRGVAAVKAIAAAMTRRDLRDFEAALAEYGDFVASDPVVQRHIARIHDSLLEQNLVRVVEPFSRVEIAHIATLLHLPQPQVEMKLSQLILDGKIRGILDQGTGVLEIFDEEKSDKTYTDAIETIKRMGSVVNSLYQKAAML